ncbi:hypothetical protein [Bizionia psychrotolerans]|uniref:hypothetical protein n=1 Tax=Bizionia psychrotolerans TaxID=1492901 RepID=UPI0006509269|nr:hypothetical protein [Bizionia psychrotolerans]
MNFNEHINAEVKTINEFIIQNEPITINKVYNESFSTFDFTFFSAYTISDYTYTVDGVCEAKTRKNNSTDYPEGALMELHKFSEIANEVARLKDEFLNINRTIKGFYLIKYIDKTFLYDIESLNPTNLRFDKLPKSSSSDGNSGWVVKPYLILPYSDAILTY